jgi:selenide,water dikinase
LTRLRHQRQSAFHVTCVTDHKLGAYSGMLPGVLGGQYPRSLMEIDLASMCASAGAELIVGQVEHINLIQCHIRFTDGRSLPFDVLSIGVGSVPSMDDVEMTAPEQVVPTKPMQTFLDRLDAGLDRVLASGMSGELAIAVVGGGLGSIELACALAPHVRARHGAHLAPQVTLVTRDSSLSAGLARGTARRLARALASRGVPVVTAARVMRVADGALELADGRRVPSALTVWATGATAPPILRTLDVPHDARGFVLTNATLRAHLDPPVFAVGDAGTLAEDPSPKAGVYAVRQTDVLWHNLHAVIDGRPLRTFTPQRSFLRLINTGDGRAIGEWKGRSFEGRLVWRLKDRIDRRFMSRLRESSHG